MNSYSKKVMMAFVCAVFVVGSSLSFTARSLAQEKAKTTQKSDKERIAALESAMQAGKEQAKVIESLQRRMEQLEQSNALLEKSNAQREQRLQLRQQDLVNTHQRDVMSLNQQIMMLDQQVRARRP